MQSAYLKHPSVWHPKQRIYGLHEHMKHLCRAKAELSATNVITDG